MAGDPAEQRGDLALPKARTGIVGFDEVTGGGLPYGRPTLVTGTAGTGKTLFGLEFVLRGARDLGEPGVVMSFAEPARDLAANVASLGFDLAAMQREGVVAVDALDLGGEVVVETGSFTLDGLFLRLESAVEEVGARRVLLDTPEALFGAFSDETVLRSELVRLFSWLKDRELTTVITGERAAADKLSRYGIEEYVSDCVIVLDHRVVDEVATRRLRIAKYRGTSHGTNEYPFLIGETGVVVVPITAIGLTYAASRERVSTGVPQLDEMLGGGVFRGSTLMVSGTAGTGKTSIAAHLADASCSRGERVLFLSLEESPDQLVRNMTSIGLDLARWREAGLLRLWAARPTAFGFEEHLAALHRQLEDVRPDMVVLDGVAGLTRLAGSRSAASVIARDVDLLKSRGITAVMTALTSSEHDSTDTASSSLVDTWLLLRNEEANGERNRLLFVIKSRGSAHTNQVREFVLTDRGAQLLDVCVAPEGVLVGSARLAHQAREQLRETHLTAEIERRRQDLDRRTGELESRIASIQGRIAAERAEFERWSAAVREDAEIARDEREAVTRSRSAGREPQELSAEGKETVSDDRADP